MHTNLRQGWLTWSDFLTTVKVSDHCCRGLSSASSRAMCSTNRFSIFSLGSSISASVAVSLVNSEEGADSAACWREAWSISAEGSSAPGTRSRFCKSFYFFRRKKLMKRIQMDWYFKVRIWKKIGWTLRMRTPTRHFMAICRRGWFLQKTNWRCLDFPSGYMWISVWDNIFARAEIWTWLAIRFFCNVKIKLKFL